MTDRKQQNKQKGQQYAQAEDANVRTLELIDYDGSAIATHTVKAAKPKDPTGRGSS